MWKLLYNNQLWWNVVIAIINMEVIQSANCWTALLGSDIWLEAGIESKLGAAAVDAAGPGCEPAVHADEAWNGHVP